MRPIPPRKAVVREADILRDIRKALAETHDVRVFRNNTGVLKDETGRPVRYGLGVGSPDLVGSILVEATHPYDSRHVLYIARAFALEVKVPGKKPTPEQDAWLKAARERGWVAEVVHSVDEALRVVERARWWEL